MTPPEVEFLPPARCDASGKVLLLANVGGARTVYRDKVDLDSERDRRRYITGLGVATSGKQRDDWDDEWEEWSNDLNRRLIELATVPPGSDQAEAAAAQDPAAAALGATPPDIRDEAEALLLDPKLFARLVDDVAAAGVVGEITLALTLYLIGVSRQLPKPLNGIVRGASSSGKSYVVEQVAALFPPEAVVRATQITPSALFYSPDDFLVHKWVIAGERSRLQDDDQAEATRALREMLEAGRLSKLVTVKGDDGRFVAELVEKEGPIAYVETTTLTHVFKEDANRCLLLQTDESEKQTRRVIGGMAVRLAGEGPGPGAKRVRAVHHAAQRMIPRRDVVIPFAPRVGELFAAARVDARRHFRHLMNLVKASALMHHRQRETDGAGNVVAARSDYEIAARLAAEPIRQAGGGLLPAATAFLARLQERYAVGAEFTTVEARNGETAVKRTISNWLNALCEAELIEQTEPSKGRVPAKWKLTGRDSAEALLGVPAAADVFAPPPGK